MYSTYSTYSVPILISWDIYVTTIVGTNKMKLYRPARYPEAEKLEAILKPSLSRAFLAPDILKAYQPTTLGNWQQCHILIIYAMNPPISFSPPNFFFLFLHCCSSYVHSCLTVIFTSVMPVLVTLFRPLDTALHPSSMNLQVQTRWILTLASFTKSSFPDISYYSAQVIPLPYPSSTSLSLSQDARQGLELVSGSRSFVCSHRRAHNRHSPRHERTRAPLTNYCRCCIESATDADTSFRYMDPWKTCRKCIIWPVLSSRCYLQRWSDSLHLFRLIAGSCTSTSLKPHMAEAPRGASRCMRNCDPRARLTSMAPNSANTLKSWSPLGSAVERESKYSAAEGAYVSHYSFFKFTRATILVLISWSSDAVAISTTSPSRKTALAQVLLQRAECRLVWVLLPVLPMTSSISSSHPCSVSWVCTTSCWFDWVKLAG